MKNIQKREFFAYQILNGDKTYKKLKKKVSLNDLANQLNKIDNEFFKNFKIWTVLIVKWHFDYLNNYLINPNQLNSTVKKLYEITLIFQDLERSNWILRNKTKKFLANKWRKSETTYDFLWPKTTIKNFQRISRKMVEPRVSQILKTIPKKFLYKKKILDSGCGTGRYIDCFNKEKPKLIVGLDKGAKIISANKKRFKKNKNISFRVGDVKKLPFKNAEFDFVCSAGVLHHSGTKLSDLIKEHQRVIKKNGYFFIFITAKGGMLKETWDFARKLLKDIPLNTIYDYLKNKINPLRMQGFIDHAYTSNVPTSRKNLEKILKKNFTSIKKLKGVPGADLTKSIYRKDKYFNLRFGEGDLRYICKK